MPLVTPQAMLVQAREEGWAVPAFNVHALDMVAPLVAAAEGERAPLILQASPATLGEVGWGPLAAVVAEVAGRATVPVALQLDHATEPALVYRAIRHGFTAVMIDGSRLPFEENVALTRRAVEAARAAGVPVEGEIGHVPVPGEPEADDPAAGFTRPEEAEAFVAATGVDMLAVAVGTVHGRYRGEPRLDLDRLAAIRARVQVPLVLHGGSGIPDALLERAVRAGIAKVNVATELKEAWTAAARRALGDSAEDDPRRVLAAAKRALQAAAAARIRALGAAGRA